MPNEKSLKVLPNATEALAAMVGLPAVGHQALGLGLPSLPLTRISF